MQRYLNERRQALKPLRWTCPFCNHSSIVTEDNSFRHHIKTDLNNIHGKQEVFVNLIACLNPDCREFVFSVTLYALSKRVKTWNLIPPSQAKVFPPYVPKPILDDYTEACLIKDLSPKASATLSRRCLQGMIRDFWKGKKDRLIDEIEGIKNKVDPLTWEAIDAVRKVGNIGAHMEKDINLIIDVEPNEASLLINLIESLINDWYINRHESEERLKAIVEMGKQKESKKETKNSKENET